MLFDLSTKNLSLSGDGIWLYLVVVIVVYSDGLEKKEVPDMISAIAWPKLWLGPLSRL